MNYGNQKGDASDLMKRGWTKTENRGAPCLRACPYYPLLSYTAHYIARSFHFPHTLCVQLLYMSHPQEAHNMSRKTACVIGAGISGLSTAWALAKSGEWDVTVLEREARLGGHSLTVPSTGNATDPRVDLGFQV